MAINWESTKFVQATFVHLTGAIALFLDKIDGGTYVALSALALGIYSIADVQDKKNIMRAHSRGEDE